MGKLRGGWFGGALTVGNGEVTTGGVKVCEAYFVLLGDLAVDLVHREGIFYFSHIVGIGLP